MNFDYTYTRLNVANYQACKQFYSDVLGFKIAFEDDEDEYTELSTGKTIITIFNRQRLGDFVDKSENVTYDPQYAGVVLSFRVACLNDAITHLKAKGVEMVKEPMNYPRRRFISAFFRAPDNNLIELEELNSYPNFG